MPTLAVQRDALVADLPDQVHRSTRRLIESQSQLVLAELSLEARAQLALRVEEAIRRHQPADALVRAKVVVVADPVTQATTSIVEVLWLGPVPKLIADGLPQTLAFAQCLGVMSAADHVLDAFLRQELLEGALPAPGEVLATLIGQHLVGFPEARDALQERLDHQHRALVRRQRPGHDVAAVVVEVDRQVHPAAMTAQHEASGVNRNYQRL